MRDLRYCYCSCWLGCMVTALLVLLPSAATAAPAGAIPEPPTVEIWKQGSVTVTAIQDLPGQVPVEIFSGPATEQEKRVFFTDGKADAGYNVFLLQVGETNVLFDAGNGDAGKTPGRLLELLAAKGIAPEGIDAVLLTHMHFDHIGGLLRSGNRAFPKARVMVAKPELDHWLGLAEKDLTNANAAMAKSVAFAYGEDLLPPFAFGDQVLPGVTALDAAGHTPGHTVFRVEADGKSLLIIGDLIHGTPLQFALPDECAVYDMDAPTAVASRKRILDLAAKEGTPVAGMHLPFPAAGMVKKEDRGYSLQP